MPTLEELFPTEPPPDKKTALQRTPEGYPFYGPETVSRGTEEAKPPLESIFGAPAATPAEKLAEKPADKAAPSVMDWLADPKKGVFPFNYPSTYREMYKESAEQVGRGIEELGKPGWEKARGAFDIGVGALGAAGSPIAAGVRSIVGQPIESATGLPKEYTEFATELAIPGLGMTKIPGVAEKARPALKAFQAVVSPETMGPTAQDAVSVIRQETGLSARSQMQTAEQLEKFHKSVEALPQTEKWNIMNYVDGGKGAVAPKTPELRDLTNTLKDAFEKRKQALQSLPKLAQQQFRQEYFPHFWKDPTAARAMAEGWAGIGRQGSGASLKARTIPTFQEGIERGLVPLYDNPIDATMRYITSIDNYVAANKILQEGVDSGMVIKAKPEAMGASGRPGGRVGIPEGYVELEGCGGQGHFAPENWARIYNNWVSRGFEQFPTGGKWYEGLRRFSNSMTQSLLGFSGYHAFTMAEASLSTELARGTRLAHGLKPGEFVKQTLMRPFAPIRYAYRGKNFKDMYLNPLSKRGKFFAVSPEDREIVDLLTEAGGRFKGTRHTLDYQASALGDYVTAWRRGKLMNEWREQGRGIRGSPITGTGKFVLSTMARSLETINKPLFQHYIPNIKNGAATELMGDWLKANQGAGKTEKLAAARKIVDSVDNRFGEMIHDNIFWNRMQKQAAVTAMLSYSWNIGGIREIGGGMRDIARAATGRGAWTPKANYAVATATNWALLSSIYQYLKTGQKPTDTNTPIMDLMAPRTGGVDSRTGEPERIIVPGIMKDVFGYYHDPQREVINKLNSGIKFIWQAGTNQDWRAAPVFQPRTPEEKRIWDALPMWLGNLMQHVWNTGAPISFQNIGKTEEGSELSTMERIIGVRTAPRYMIAPEEEEAARQKRAIRAWRAKEKFEQRQRQRYGGPQ